MLTPCAGALRVRPFATPGMRLRDERPLLADIGIATFPQDGTELTTLLACAKRRSDRAALSAAKIACNDAEDLNGVLDSLFWQAASETSRNQLAVLEVPLIDLVGLANAVVHEARRGGEIRLAATDSPGLSMGRLVRSALRHDAEDVELVVADVRQALTPGLEAISVFAEHGCYGLLGRREGSLIRAVHASDPLLADLIFDLLESHVGGDS